MPDTGTGLLNALTTPVAWTGAERLALGLTDGLDVEARARWPLDAHATPALGAGRQGAKA